MAFWKTFRIVIVIWASGFALMNAQLTSDCFNATPIPTLIYNVPVINYPPETVPGEVNTSLSCLSNGELNGLWFEFEAATGGILCFDIIPNTPSDSFDWALYDLTNNQCTDIFSNASLEVACGTSGVSGPAIPAVAGQFFKLLITNYAATTSGYQIDFSCSTCSLNPSVGTPTNHLSSQIKTGPNPTNGPINLTINPSIENELTNLKLIDLTGKTLFSQSSGFASNMQLDLSNHASGLYFLQISTSSEQHSIKIILE